MTDPELADATYIEPLTVEFLERIIAIERPDTLLPTLGGQTALNLALMLADKGVLKNIKLSSLEPKNLQYEKLKTAIYLKKPWLKLD